MLQGAIIGLIVGLIVAGITVAKRKGLTKKVTEAFQTGGSDAAKQALDAAVAPIGGKVAMNKLLDTIDRVAALALLGQNDALRQELDAVDGKLTVVTQIKAMGLAGLALNGDAAAIADELEAVAAKVEQEGGGMLKLVKRNTRNIADAVKTIAGNGEISREQRAQIASYANGSGPFTKPLLYKLLAETTQATGGNPEHFDNLYKQSAGPLAA